MLQGAGGMHVYPAECLRVMREVADEHDLVLVFDEIATGFGRTGTMFAADAAGVSPDIMCVGKALTGGYLTLAAVLCTPTIGAADLGLRVRGADARADVHGQPARLRGGAGQPRPARPAPTGPARSPGSARGLARGPRPAAATCPASPTCAPSAPSGVVQLDHPVDVVKATDAAVEEGVWLRPFRDLIYTMPPYVTTDDGRRPDLCGDRTGRWRSA